MITTEPKEAPVWNFNQGQQAALDFFVPFMLERYSSKRLALLEGPAGTGKTFITNRIIEAARAQNPALNIGMTAPTHKAVRQLKKHSELKDVLDFGTIHSYLSLKEKQVENPRKKGEMIIVYEPEWNPDNGRKVDTLDVLIIDESSMLGDVLYGHIEDAYRSNKNLKVIFIGDGIQIPPVKEKHLDKKDQANKLAIPFVPEQRRSRGIEHIKLEEIVRQGAGNPIIEYATAIRHQYKNQAINHEFVPSSDPEKGIELIPRKLEALREVFTKYFDTDAFRKDPDYVKVVAWRNDTVKYFNREIRLLLNKATELPFVIKGDKLIMDKPLIKGDKVLIPNNEELDIVDVEIVNVPVKYRIIDRKNAFEQLESDEEEPGVKVYEQNFKTYKATAVDTLKRTFVINIIHEEDEAQFESLRQKIASKAKNAEDMFDRKTMWKQFFDLDKPFAKVKHNYCLTAHKAQGSTYDYCISMEWDINVDFDIEERNRIKYVAATRPRNKLFIIR